MKTVVVLLLSTFFTNTFTRPIEELGKTVVGKAAGGSAGDFLKTSGNDGDPLGVDASIIALEGLVKSAGGAGVGKDLEVHSAGGTFIDCSGTQGGANVNLPKVEFGTHGAVTLRCSDIVNFDVKS